MKIHRTAILPLLFCLLLAAGCQQPGPETGDMTPVRGYVTDMASFDAFIESAPTPDEFRERYPDVVLVLPGEPATMELRSNNSRYFAELDEEGHIIDGRFQ